VSLKIDGRISGGRGGEGRSGRRCSGGSGGLGFGMNRTYVGRAKHEDVCKEGRKEDWRNPSVSVTS